MLKCDLVGSKFIEGAQAMLRRLQIGDELQIMRDRDDPDDPNAVALYYAGQKLGYVPRAFNWNVAPMLDRGTRLLCHIHRPVVVLETDKAIFETDRPQIIIKRDPNHDD